MGYSYRYMMAVILFFSSISSYSQLKTIERQLDRVDSILVKNKNESAILPGPIYNPSFGPGIAILPIHVYHLKSQSEDTKPSSTQGIILLSHNKSVALGVKQTIFLKSNKYWLEGMVNYASIRLQYYGIGYTPKEQTPGWVRVVGSTIDLSLQRRLKNKLYGGVTFNFKLLELNGEEEATNDWLIEDGFSTDRQNILLTGLKFSYDHRNHLFTPSSGVLGSMFISHSSAEIGSDLNYTLFGFTCSNYVSVTKNKNVLASQIYYRGSSGEVPLFDYSTPGRSKVLRGYISGKYLDQSILTFQSEYRFKVKNNWGAVVFVGAGKVFPEIKQFDNTSWLPSVGSGVRYRILKTQNVNARLDLAFGKNDFNVYFGISEVF